MNSVRDFVDIHNIDCMVPINYTMSFRHKLWNIRNKSNNVRTNVYRGLEKTLGMSPVLNRKSSPNGI